MSKKPEDGTITKASNLNRLLLVIAVIFIVLNFFNTRALNKSTADMNSKFIKQKVAVDTNTRQILQFMGQWRTTQQQLSDWMQKQREIQDKIAEDNRGLKIPKPPPIPPSLPKPQVHSTPEPRATTQPVVQPTPEPQSTPTPRIEYRTRIKRVWVSTPTPKPLLDYFKSTR